MKKEYLYAGFAILSWSTIATISKLLLGSLDSMQITFLSSAFATAFLLVLNIAKGNMKLFKQYKAREYLVMSGIGILGIFIYHLFLYMGIDCMDASQAFIINYLWPIMSVLSACIILKEKMTVRKGIAILLSFAGVIIVTANGNLLNIGKDTLTGALYCVIAAVSYGLFSTLNKKKDYDKYFSMMIFYLAATVVSLAYIIATKSNFTLDAMQVTGLMWMGIFTNAIAFTFWAIALKMGDTAKVSNLAYITPFLSLVWTTVVLGENFNPYSLIGLSVIVLGIFIQLKDKKEIQK